jgi:hypothetical protein
MDETERETITPLPFFLATVNHDNETFSAKVRELLQPYEKDKPQGIFY